MADDYRNSKYCPKLTDLTKKKNDVKDSVSSKHPRAQDMHTYISNNNEPFKQQFIEAYNGKCAYCGVSTEIIPWKMFEIDHLIPKEADRFGKSKANAGYIENLVLSCYDCNRAKSDLEFHDQDLHKIHPDKAEITEAFIRDDNYYIKISEKKNGDKTIKEFYEKLDLGNQLHRLDYLLFNMRGLCKEITDKHPAYGKLMEAIELLQHKRNVMR